MNSGLEIIKKFEGCRLTAYPDPGTGGKPWTIGYGCTRTARGDEWKRGDVINAGNRGRPSDTRF